MNLNFLKKISSALILVLVLCFVLFVDKGVITKAATSDTIGMTINIGTALTIDVTPTSITIADLTIDTEDTSGTTTITVASNDPTAFHVDALLRDLDGASGAELCVNDAGGCSATILDVFDTDDGTHSYWKLELMESHASSTVDTLTGYASAIDAGSATVLSTTDLELFEATDTTEEGVSDSAYIQHRVYADSTVPERQYEGDIYFTITSGT